jgi:hypothetical protein
MAHAGERVEGGSISPDLPQGLDYRTELLAGRARAAAETLEIPVTYSADKRTLTGVPLVDYCKATVSPKRGSFEPSLPSTVDYCYAAELVYNLLIDGLGSAKHFTSCLHISHIHSRIHRYCCALSSFS